MRMIPEIPYAMRQVPRTVRPGDRGDQKGLGSPEAARNDDRVRDAKETAGRGSGGAHPAARPVARSPRGASADDTAASDGPRGASDLAHTAGSPVAGGAAAEPPPGMDRRPRGMATRAGAGLILLAVLLQPRNSVARCPNGCSGHGSCDADLVCTCDADYAGAPDCSRRKLCR